MANRLKQSRSHPTELEEAQANRQSAESERQDAQANLKMPRRIYKCAANLKISDVSFKAQK